MKNKIYKGNCVEVLPKVKNKFDLIIIDPPYQEGYEKYFNLYKDKLKENGQILYFVQPTEVFNLPKPNQILIWLEPISPKPIYKKYREFLDFIAWYAYGDYTFNKLLWNLMNSRFDDTIIRDKREHKWEKPKSLMKKLVLIHTNKGDSVLEPFVGSDNLLEVCKEVKRKYTGVKL